MDSDQISQINPISLLGLLMYREIEICEPVAAAVRVVIHDDSEEEPPTSQKKSGETRAAKAVASYKAVMYGRRMTTREIQAALGQRCSPHRYLERLREAGWIIRNDDNTWAWGGIEWTE